MWQLIRSDAINAFKEPLIIKILPRYVKVVNDELPAHFQITKRIEAIFDANEGNEKLWNLHNTLLKKFYETKKKVDKEKIKLSDLKIPKTSLLDLKIFLVKEIMKACELCERRCGVNRWAADLGICKVGNRCLISSEHIHLGEEFHITPSHTIFFMGCPFKCQYCQNWTISQWYESGIEINGRILAEAIEQRRIEGSRNVNFVGGEPTPSLLWILESLKYCKVNIPAIWNSNMYMSEKTMKILEGVIDMYLADFKYGNNECAFRLSKVPRFFETCTRNHMLAVQQAEMTLRHLVLPDHIECCTKPVLKWISENIREKCIVNIMDQYTPYWKANLYPEINREISKEEFKTSVDFAKDIKLNFIT